MPEWLLVNEEYIPPKSKDGFIDKSILSILAVIDKFKRQTEYKAGKIGINPLIKLISVLVFIILISLCRSTTFLLINGVAMLVLLNFMPVKDIKNILKISFVVSIFTFIILLPSFLGGYGNNIFKLTSKVFLTVVYVNSLAVTTQWNDIIRALKIFRVPDMFVFVLDITIKYIMILGEFSLNMVYALKLRAVGSSRNKSASISGIIGTVFIKSKDMAEETQEAMECRGFTGEYRVYKKFKFKFSDYGFVMLDIIFIALYIYFDRL